MAVSLGQQIDDGRNDGETYDEVDVLDNVATPCREVHGCARFGEDVDVVAVDQVYAAVADATLDIVAVLVWVRLVQEF